MRVKCTTIELIPLNKLHAGDTFLYSGDIWIKTDNRDASRNSAMVVSLISGRSMMLDQSISVDQREFQAEEVQMI